MKEMYKIEGLPVTKTYYKGQQPAISNGLFKLTNNTAEKIHVGNLEIKLVTSQKEMPITEYHIYQTPEYNEIPKESLYVEEHSEVTLDISFPFVYENMILLNDIHVDMMLIINGKKYTAHSPVKIIMRIN